MPATWEQIQDCTSIKLVLEVVQMDGHEVD